MPRYVPHSHAMIRFGGLIENQQEANLPLPKAPVLFTKPRSALAGPFPAALNIPKCAQDGTSDYEAELCLVIGKSGRDISEDEALDYVLGYTASNDVSARNFQKLTGQWSFSKGLDGSCPIGKSFALELNSTDRSDTHAIIRSGADCPKYNS